MRMSNSLRRLSALAILAVGLAIAPPSIAQIRVVRCVRVTSGGVLHFEQDYPSSDSFIRRLWGVGCPYDGEPGAARVKQFLQKLCVGKQVRVEEREVLNSPSQIPSALVWVNGQNVNEAVVREGVGWWYRQEAPDDDSLRLLENEARTARRGLWAHDSERAPTGGISGLYPRSTVENDFTQGPVSSTTRYMRIATGLIGVVMIWILFVLIKKAQKQEAPASVPERVPVPPPPVPPPAPPPPAALPDDLVRAYALQIVLDRSSNMSEVKAKLEKEFDPANAARILKKIEALQQVSK